MTDRKHPCQITHVGIFVFVLLSLEFTPLTFYLIGDVMTAEFTFKAVETKTPGAVLTHSPSMRPRCGFTTDPVQYLQE